MNFFQKTFYLLWGFEKHLNLLYDLQSKYSKETFRHLRRFDVDAARQSYAHWMEIAQRINLEIRDVIGQPHTKLESFEVWFEGIFKVK